MNQRLVWILIAFGSAMLAAPNATVLRHTLLTTDPLYFSLLRFLIAGAVCLPFLYYFRRKITKRSFRYAAVSGIFISLAILFYMLALVESQASYVVIMTLLTPIFFISLSSILVHETISHRAAAGITIAMLGAFTLVAAPIAFSNSASVQFYPLATGYMLLNSLFFALAIIWMRKANEAKLPIVPTVGIQAFVAIIIFSVCFIVFGDSSATETSPNVFAAAIYSGVVVALIARSLNVLAYERLGSVLISGLGYIELLVALLLPLIFLKEQLSPTMVAGGILILLGVYVIERRKAHIHKASHHVYRHH